MKGEAHKSSIEEESSHITITTYSGPSDDKCRYGPRDLATRENHMQQTSQSLVLFSWGYWGWGSCSSKFVESVDLVERARGFQPPIFIDARFRRDGRAPEFQGAAFEKVVGAERYRWMIGLGNEGVGTGNRQLHDLEAITQLLALADKYALQERRVIFYCACALLKSCHRQDISTELELLAKKQKRKISVVEWPGTDVPEMPIRWKVSQKVLAAVERGQKNFELPEGVTLTEAASVAWYTPLTLTAGDDQLPVLIGPAKYLKERWWVQVLKTFDEREVSTRELRRAVVQGRAAGQCGYRGCPPMLVNSARKSQS
jgi:hypothetical protein